MLELIDIKKNYTVAGGTVSALKGVSVKFRRNEFVSILGASGCGKTTLLNIIGGLDKYTSGDLVIEGKSTKKYKDGDWDTYRNHSIGFIFQSYHLIPHQTVLQNVELALLISGVSKEERRRRAIEALERVGLGDKLKNRPNQLSGGQAQRVAIARALINDPEIVLADEPTGALDSKTSVQIMELLKEISKDRLVIMVTHNPELAEQYSTRIIRLLDGEIVDDNNPYDGSAEEEVLKKEEPSPAVTEKTNKGKKKRTSMSIGMAMSLSLKNLLSKRKRSIMVSVAGSIGIIGVSMVLAISAGVKDYVKSMEDDMLSGYPLAVTETAIDFDALMEFSSSSGTKVNPYRLKDKVYVDDLLGTLMDFKGATSTNEITEDYKKFVDAMPATYYNALQYGYGFDMSNYIYADFTVGGTCTDGKQNVSVTAIRAKYSSVLGEQKDYKKYSSMINTLSSFKELPNNYDYILSQYDILATSLGKTEELTENEIKEIFNSKESLIMVVSDNGFSDLNFGQYGYMTEWEFLNFAFKATGDVYDREIIEKYNGRLNADKNGYEGEKTGTDFSVFVGEDAHKFTWYPNDSIYTPCDGTESYTINNQLIRNAYLDEDGKPTLQNTGKLAIPYKYEPNSKDFNKDDGVELGVKVILQKKAGISYGCLNSGLYYTEELTKHTLETGLKSNIVKDLKDKYDGEISILPFHYDYTYLNPDAGNIWQTNTADSGIGLYSSMMSQMMGAMTGSSSKQGLDLNDLAGNELPVALYIYSLDFESKDLVTDYLDKWNDGCEKGSFTFTDKDGNEVVVSDLEEADKVNYTDTVGLIITMVNTMIEMITIALIAFTALSLVVSTVMIGIITYVSVVERVKEIGILRAVGARKKDIKRLFNAETFLLGLSAGLVGILVTYLLSLIINIIVMSLAGIAICALPIWQALIMVVVSIVLTLISGLIPASAAAKKDPVVALRTE
ncbi:MAG: ABC transporter ATP-binding protein/permease [Clostridia bacterium]|nr:ABC transporter ATP-binding protein/permease [Clostridia bacterium]